MVLSAGEQARMGSMRRRACSGYYRTWVVREDLAKKVTLGQRPEGGGSHWMSGKSFPGSGTSMCKGPEVGCIQHVQGEARRPG